MTAKRKLLDDRRLHRRPRHDRVSLSYRRIGLVMRFSGSATGAVDGSHSVVGAVSLDPSSLNPWRSYQVKGQLAFA